MSRNALGICFSIFLCGCLFEVSPKPFDAKIIEVKRVGTDSLKAVYDIKYSGWTQVDSLNVYVAFESCRDSIFYINGKWEAGCYPDYDAARNIKVFRLGNFNGSQKVTWTLNQGDTAYVQLYISYREEKTWTLGFSGKVRVVK
jgi:hypothetical protein